jgi:tetratricopeptide (TPR) repeat protein
MRSNKPWAIFVAVLCLVSASSAFAAECNMVWSNSSGRPHDFRDPQENGLLKDVEKYHFNRDTERLLAGTSKPLPLDIAYALGWFGNHYRALNAMGDWQLAHGYVPTAEYFEAECYFQRAAAFTPTDPEIYVIWGNHHYKKAAALDKGKNHAEAVDEYRAAVAKYEQGLAVDPQSAEAEYDLGLAYVRLGDYQNAKVHADRAYSLGYPLQGLRHLLEQMEHSTSTQPGKALTKN